jgi:hypothetical protein
MPQPNELKLVQSVRFGDLDQHLHRGAAERIVEIKGNGAPLIFPPGQGPGLLARIWNAFSTRILGKHHQLLAVVMTLKQISGEVEIESADAPHRFSVEMKLGVRVEDLAKLPPDRLRSELAAVCDEDCGVLIKEEAIAIIRKAMRKYRAEDHEGAERDAANAIAYIDGPITEKRSFCGGLVRLEYANITVHPDKHINEAATQIFEVETRGKVVAATRAWFQKILPQDTVYREFLLERLAHDPSKLNDVYQDLRQLDKEWEERHEKRLKEVLDLVGSRPDMTPTEIATLIRNALAPLISQARQVASSTTAGQIPADQAKRDDTGDRDS